MTSIRVALAARRGTDGYAHKYRADHLDDATRATVSPRCDRDEHHDRVKVAGASPSGSPWCGKGCQFLPDRVAV